MESDLCIHALINCIKVHAALGCVLNLEGGKQKYGKEQLHPESSILCDLHALSYSHLPTRLQRSFSDHPHFTDGEIGSEQE